VLSIPHWESLANNDGKARYDKTIEIDHKSTDAWNGKGVALDNLGKHNEAIESYDRVIKIDPNDARKGNQAPNFHFPD
jgi:tetratricopeptide (TPR) repeat protein